jgi:hypothetical protein
MNIAIMAFPLYVLADAAGTGQALLQPAAPIAWRMQHQ